MKTDRRKQSRTVNASLSSKLVLENDDAGIYGDRIVTVSRADDWAKPTGVREESPMARLTLSREQEGTIGVDGKEY